MLIPSLASYLAKAATSLSRRVNANSQRGLDHGLQLPSLSRRVNANSQPFAKYSAVLIKLIKKGEC